jgi:PhzF family phenazine biosynthesis protein
VRAFAQVDVFSSEPYGGNPVAVVLDGEGLSLAQMEAFTRWTNLSECAFLLPSEVADYRVRIFTGASTASELPFAGHPTLGACHAWLAAGGVPRGEMIMQECGAGLIGISRTPRGLAFAAPPLIRGGPVDPDTVAHIAEVLSIGVDDIVDAAWADNGPGWVAVLLGDAEAVLALRPASVDLDLGVVGLYPPGTAARYEVRAFFPQGATTVEDPVTGSLNASVAQWLIATGRVTAPYMARQGTALGRAGEIHVSQAAGELWVAGATSTRITGHVDL